MKPMILVDLRNLLINLSNYSHIQPIAIDSFKEWINKYFSDKNKTARDVFERLKFTISVESEGELYDSNNEPAGPEFAYKNFCVKYSQVPNVSLSFIRDLKELLIKVSRFTKEDLMLVECIKMLRQFEHYYTVYLSNIVHRNNIPSIYHAKRLLENRAINMSSLFQDDPLIISLINILSKNIMDLDDATKLRTKIINILYTIIQDIEIDVEYLQIFFGDIRDIHQALTLHNIYTYSCRRIILKLHNDEFGEEDKLEEIETVVKGTIYYFYNMINLTSNKDIIHNMLTELIHKIGEMPNKRKTDEMVINIIHQLIFFFK